MSGRTHYEVLEVDPGLASSEVRKAYLKLAREYHPDNFQDPAQRDHALTMMSEINGAWEVLGDADARERYDRDLRLAGRLPPLVGDGQPAPTSAEGSAAGGPRGSRRLTMLPMVTLAAAVVLFAGGAILGERGLMLAGVVGAVLAACFFFLVPLLLMRKAAQQD